MNILLGFLGIMSVVNIMMVGSVILKRLRVVKKPGRRKSAPRMQ